MPCMLLYRENIFNKLTHNTIRAIRVKWVHLHTRGMELYFRVGFVQCHDSKAIQ